MLTSQRRAAAAATCDRGCGANLDLTLVVADGFTVGAADPAFEAHTGVVHMWALAVWEAWPPPPWGGGDPVGNRVKRVVAKAMNLFVDR